MRSILVVSGKDVVHSLAKINSKTYTSAVKISQHRVQHTVVMADARG